MSLRRNVLAICAIVAVAVAVIVVTALVAGGGSDSNASTTTTSVAPTPDLDGMLLDRNTLSEIMGNVPLDVEARQDFLNRPADDATSLPACRSVDTFGDASLYADAPWRGVRLEDLKQPDPQNAQLVRQAVLWMPSEGASKELLDKASKDWSACSGKPFTASGTRWVLQDLTERDDTIVAVTRVEGPASDWSCQHALGVKDNFVAEAHVCGRGAGQAERVVQEILAKGNS